MLTRPLKAECGDGTSGSEAKVGRYGSSDRTATRPSDAARSQSCRRCHIDVHRPQPPAARLRAPRRYRSAGGSKKDPRASGWRSSPDCRCADAGRQCSGHLLARREGSTFAILMEGIDPAAAADVISAACAASSAREMKVRDNDQHWGGSCSHLAS